MYGIVLYITYVCGSRKKINDAIKKSGARVVKRVRTCAPDIPTYFAHKPHNRKSRSGRSTWLGGQAFLFYFFILLYALWWVCGGRTRDGKGWGLYVCNVHIRMYVVMYIVHTFLGSLDWRLKKISYAAQLKNKFYHVLHFSFFPP